MHDLRRYGALRTIQLLRGVIRRWWGVELAFADATGYVLDHAEGKIIPPANDFCRAALFSRDGFRRCNESVLQVRDRLRAPGRSRPALLHECFLGFDLVSAPIQLDGELAGFLFVGGSRRVEPGQAARTRMGSLLRELAPGMGDAGSARIPLLSSADLDRLMDLLEAGAAQIEADYADRVVRERERTALRRERGDRQREVGARGAFAGIVGASRPMQQLFRLLEKLAPSTATVLVQGEGGAGKELVARALHLSGPRAQGPFVVLHCSAFSEQLLERALCGQVVDAAREQKGQLELAHGGTLFLDEVGALSPALQVRLLGALEAGVCTPVGASEARRVDVRVIAATQDDLAARVARGDFREDLYYRLAALSVVVPPLRLRGDDLPLLIDHFLTLRHQGDGPPPHLDAAALAALAAYGFPGNVRELETEVERLLVLGGAQQELGVELLSPRIRTAAAAAESAASGGRTGTLRDAVLMLERDLIQQGLIRTHWNKSQLARELGMSRTNLIQKCVAYGFERGDE